MFRKDSFGHDGVLTSHRPAGTVLDADASGSLGHRAPCSQGMARALVFSLRPLAFPLEASKGSIGMCYCMRTTLVANLLCLEPPWDRVGRVGTSMLLSAAAWIAGRADLMALWASSSPSLTLVEIGILDDHPFIRRIRAP